jgi:hypothetical protein
MLFSMCMFSRPSTWQEPPDFHVKVGAACHIVSERAKIVDVD